MLDVNFPENIKCMWTGFDKIIKLKNNSPCLHWRTYITIFCWIGKTFKVEPIKFPWPGFNKYSPVASQLLKYTVQFIFIINLSDWSLLQDAGNSYWVG